jgi:hypothetical protein
LEERFSARNALLGLSSRLGFSRKSVVFLEGVLEEVSSAGGLVCSEGVLIFFESINTIVTEVTENISLLLDEVLEFSEESELVLSSSRRVDVFSVESLAHIDSVLEGFSVTRRLESSRSWDISFSANASGKSGKVLVEVINGNSEVSKDSIVLSDGGFVDFNSGSFFGNSCLLGFVEVLKKAVEEGFKLINDITTDSTFEARCLEERSNDSTELGGLVSLNHVGEHLVHVRRKLNEAGTITGILLVVVEDWVDSLDGGNSGVKFVVDKSGEGS